MPACAGLDGPIEGELLAQRGESSSAKAAC